MRPNPDYAMTDLADVAALLHDHPWCTIVSHAPGRGIVASHYPVLVDDDADGFSVFSHVGKPDERLHELGEHELTIIVEGPQGYISPGWYGVSPAVPTWNFVVAHLTGTPEVVSLEENLRLMDRLVDFFEDQAETPTGLHASAANTAYAKRIVHGTVAFRMTVDRFEAKCKMSQDKPDAVVAGILEGLSRPGPFRNPPLERYMRALRDRGAAGD
ncbi:FMN-binding negative transcriptional regulator [Demequina sp.]|uniref:FMN-binding negative transcriptional regulator n=1 Tax=Demequina sp. TaxID=2050685 RepID=UPI0025BBE349|nr:FMN-binding negative transcriptional regulator [Demequina sp.]